MKTKISKVECVVDAIGDFNGILDPQSTSYKLKNPLLVTSFSKPGAHEVDEEGHRVFESLINGYRACIFDLSLKVSGKSRSGLRTGATLTNLLGVYGLKGAGPMSRIVRFLRNAIGDETISSDTPIEYFREES